MARFVRWTVLTAAAALLATGCGGGPSDDPKTDGDTGGTSASAPAGSPETALPSSLTSQELDWGRCRATEGSPAPGDEWQCADLKAPLDWKKPEGRTIDLAMIRAKATGDDRIGSLLFNFGGPGGSGVDRLPWYSTSASALRERYDLVSWDPRGVGSSEGVRCRRDQEIQAPVHLLFIAGSDPARVGRLMRAAPAVFLTVTECANPQHCGSVINFRIVDERVRFDVSLDAAEKNNVKLSSRLLTVANRVQKGAP